ncbi:MAG: hypothetical protein NT076_00555 [Candidatus Pacearchaeota archaeon]|nr:hypothetical protein [Candidatus Pacearchaeota archaeon]
MITTKELGSLLLSLIILSFSYAFLSRTLFIVCLVFFAIILALTVLAKKTTAYYLEAEEETKLWTFQRHGFYSRSYFKNPFPIGIIASFILPLITLGYIPWLAVLESDVKGTSMRAARRHDFYSYGEMTEWHIALISAAGIIVCFILAPVAYFLNFSLLAKLSLFYAAFNLLPLGKLDGTRIFFGSKILYALLVAIGLIGLFYAFLMP